MHSFLPISTVLLESINPTHSSACEGRKNETTNHCERIHHRDPTAQAPLLVCGRRLVLLSAGLHSTDGQWHEQLSVP